MFSGGLSKLPVLEESARLIESPSLSALRRPARPLATGIKAEYECRGFLGRFDIAAHRCINSIAIESKIRSLLMKLQCMGGLL
jgi:hypothetical protein